MSLAQHAMCHKVHMQIYTKSLTDVTTSKAGGLAQLVERVLSMHEVSGSIPEFSTHFFFRVVVSQNELIGE